MPALSPLAQVSLEPPRGGACERLRPSESAKGETLGRIFADRALSPAALAISEAGPNKKQELEQKEVTKAERKRSYPITQIVMRSVNKIILVGNVAADPEVRQTPKGTTVATFPVATDRDFTSGNERKKVTDFHRVVAWGKLGEICGQYLEKGKAVYVEGTVINRAYEKDGERRYLTEIRADEVNMLSYKKSKDAERIVITPFDDAVDEARN